jgi:hypothetical protein
MKDQATAIRTVANTAYNNASVANNYSGTASTICEQSKTAIVDKSSNAYKSLVTGCSTLTGTDQAQALAAFNLAQSTADSLLVVAATTSTSTKSQKSAEDGFKQLSSTLQDLLKENDQYLKTTISIDQGKAIKVYITKDYIFSKEAVIKKGASR